MMYPFDLTEKEVGLIRALCEGRTLEAAAIDLGLNRHTAGDSLKVIHGKLGVRCRAALAVKAERAGLLEGIAV